MFKVQQDVEKRSFMLRQAQHARIFVNHFKPISARPGPVEGLRVSFSTACQRRSRDLNVIVEP
jgi:hypothetical protein